ncbi:hypothetical protein [Shewanella sp. 125m-1]
MNKFIKSLFSRSADLGTASETVAETISAEKISATITSETTTSAEKISATTTSETSAEHEYSFQHHRLYYDGLIQLQIVKRSGFNIELLSQFELVGSDNCELLLVEWLDDERFIAVDSIGRIYSACFSSGARSDISNGISSDMSLNTSSASSSQSRKPSKLSLVALTSLELYPTNDACCNNGKLWLVGAKQGGRRSARSMYCIDIGAALNRQASAAAENYSHTKVGSFELLCTDISCYEMPFRFVNGSMVYLADNEFVFYQREKRRMHQLVSFSPLSSEMKVHPLEGKPAPTEISVRNTFFMDNQRGIALLANAETVSMTVSTDTDASESIAEALNQAEVIAQAEAFDQAEAPGFDFVLQLIDFKQKKALWSRSVRTLNPSQICASYQAEELVASLTAIAAGDSSSSHHDELQTFVECLTSATVAADGNSIWLGWQDGVVQQLSLTGECIFPMKQLMQRNSGGILRSLQVFGLEPVVIKSQIDDQLLVAVGDEEDGRIWLMDLADKKQGSSASLVSAVCRQKGVILDIPAGLTEVPTQSGQVDIFYQDLNDTSAKLATLETLNALMPKLQLHYHASYELMNKNAPNLDAKLELSNEQNKVLNKTPNQALKQEQAQDKPLSLFFGFVTQQVNGCTVQSEYDLFASAGYDEKGADLLASIIKQFASWDCAAHLSGLKGAPVMADAVLALADKKEYLDILAEYFNAIGANEPIHPFHVHRTMVVIREQHADSPELAAFMAKVHWPWNDVSFSVPNVGAYD